MVVTLATTRLFTDQVGSPEHLEMFRYRWAADIKTLCQVAHGARASPQTQQDLAANRVRERCEDVDLVHAANIRRKDPTRQQYPTHSTALGATGQEACPEVLAAP